MQHSKAAIQQQLLNEIHDYMWLWTKRSEDCNAEEFAELSDMLVEDWRYAMGALSEFIETGDTAVLHKALEMQDTEAREHYGETIGMLEVVAT